MCIQRVLCAFSAHYYIGHVLYTQAKALLTDDYGKDLASVEALIRRHDELERDLTAIENKLEVCEHHTLCILCMYCWVK